VDKTFDLVLYLGFPVRSMSVADLTPGDVSFDTRFKIDLMML
jgi:hypothetical protein